MLARQGAQGLQPWAGEGWTAEHRQLSEVSAAARRLARLALPDQDLPEIAAIKAAWPEWLRSAMILCPVASDGGICEGLRYDSETGLVFYCS